MAKRTKLWKSISAITLAGVAAGMTGCDTKTEEENVSVQQETPTEPAETAAPPIMSAEGEGGEGEGEGEGASKADLASDDQAYLTQLGLMRGHLNVGFQLYQEGYIEQAKPHMSHPEGELYSALAPAFNARKTTGFADELSTLSDAVEQAKSKEQVAQAYEALTKAISVNEAAVSEASSAPTQRLKLIAELLRMAGAEYAIAVVEGKMENAHKYQSAWGFTSIAENILEDITSEDQEILDAKKSASELLNAIKLHWPSIIPPETLSTESSAIYGAAARIEILALGID